MDHATERLYEILAANLTYQKRLEIVSLLDESRRYLRGHDGGGLSGGVYAEGILLETMGRDADTVKTSHVGEADAEAIDDNGSIPFSIKTLNGENGGDLALDWSRNDSTKDQGAVEVERERFTCPIVISVRESSKWWKWALRGFQRQDNQPVRAGIYVVDPAWCRENIMHKLTRNNKSNSVIKRCYVIQMIRRAEIMGRFIPYPKERMKTQTFSIRCAFGFDA